MAGPTGRLLALLSLLQARRDWPGAVLAERLEVTQRTVRRDVERLRELGYTVRSSRGPDGGYRLDAGEDLPPLLLDDEQAVAMALALGAARSSGADIQDGAHRALVTLQQVMPSRLRHRLAALQVDDAGRGGSSEAADPTVLLALGAAVRSQEVLRLDHAGRRRRVEPHHLVARQGRWYLVGWDLDREDWRTFRADRVRPVVPNGPRFSRRTLPGDDVGAFLTARFRGARHGTGWPCRGEVVVALPAAEAAPYLADAEVEEVGDGSCRVRAGSWSWTGLAASLLRLDADVEVVSPPALREAFATLAARAGAAGQA